MRVINLASGSKGNVTLVESDKEKVLIDCGISLREVEKRLLQVGTEPKDISAIFISHIHSDHILSVKDFSNKYDVPIYADQAVFDQGKLGNISEKNKICLMETQQINDLYVQCFEVSHDAKPTYGFMIKSGGRKISIATDTGKVTAGMMSVMRGSDLVLIESNHDVKMLLLGRYPQILKRRINSEFGHLSNEDCGKFIVSLANSGTKHFLLMHLSEQNNTPEMAENTVRQIVNDCFLNPDEINIFLASQNHFSKNFILKGKEENHDK